MKVCKFGGSSLSNGQNYRHAIDNGLVYLSEDRKKYGLVVPMSVKENLTMSILYQISKGTFIDFKTENQIVEKYMKDLSVKAPDKDFVVENLSGGNQQKVLLAKALCAKPKILILDEPTRGVDVGAKAEIYKIIKRLSEQGISIIMISSEMPELLGMSDRVVVIKEGRKVGEVERKDFSQEKVLGMAL